MRQTAYTTLRNLSSHTLKRASSDFKLRASTTPTLTQNVHSQTQVVRAQCANAPCPSPSFCVRCVSRDAQCAQASRTLCARAHRPRYHSEGLFILRPTSLKLKKPLTSKGLYCKTKHTCSLSVLLAPLANNRTGEKIHWHTLSFAVYCRRANEIVVYVVLHISLVCPFGYIYDSILFPQQNLVVVVVVLA